MDKIARRRRAELLARVKAKGLHWLNRLVNGTTTVLAPFAVLFGGFGIAIFIAIWAVDQNLSDSMIAFIVFVVMLLVMIPSAVAYRMGLKSLRNRVKAARDDYHEKVVKRKRLERRLAHAPELASSDQGLSLAAEAGGEGQLSLEGDASDGGLSEIKQEEILVGDAEESESVVS